MRSVEVIFWATWYRVRPSAIRRRSWVEVHEDAMPTTKNIKARTITSTKVCDCPTVVSVFGSHAQLPGIHDPHAMPWVPSRYTRNVMPPIAAPIMRATMIDDMSAFLFNVY